MSVPDFTPVTLTPCLDSEMSNAAKWRKELLQINSRCYKKRNKIKVLVCGKGSPTLSVSDIKPCFSLSINDLRTTGFCYLILEITPLSVPILGNLEAEYLTCFLGLGWVFVKRFRKTVSGGYPASPDVQLLYPPRALGMGNIQICLIWFLRIDLSMRKQRRWSLHLNELKPL